MPRCFVIQPFDNGEFDKRYDDVLVPAIEKAGLKPYRVDRDPSASVLIESIEEHIQNSEVCLADISLDNPNIWYEVGFAIASGKEIILICSDKRATPFPFDVQHRRIIKYTTHSNRDFNKLAIEIADSLKICAKKAKIITEFPPIKPTEGLRAHETACLILLMENRLTSESVTYPTAIVADMRRAGFNKFAASISLEWLKKQGLIEPTIDRDYNGNQQDTFRVTDEGVEWCLANQAKFEMRQEPQRSGNPKTSGSMIDDTDDDIPF